MGNFIATFDRKLPASSKREEFWKIAKHLSTVIEEDVKKAKHIRYVSMLEAAPEAILAEMARENSLDISERRFSGHLLSSMGNFDWQCCEDDVFKLDDVYIAADSGQMFGNYCVTINGKLSWVVACDRSGISRELAQRYSDCALEILTGAL